MNARRIHFAHANGFPSLTYAKLFRLLEPEFSVGYLEKHAHNPDYPVTDNWKYLARELADEIKERYDRPVIGVGHSLGGVLHLLASFEEPELYSEIVLLDAPIISPASSFGLKVLKKTGLLKRYPPASTTRFRRRTFADREQAADYFLKRRKFAAFDPEVLADYLEHGLMEEEDGRLRLSFEPEIEAEIYSTIPTDLPEYKGKLSVDTFYIGGSSSEEARLARLGFMKKNFPIEFRFIEGTHLFPMESPELTASVIKKLLI